MIILAWSAEWTTSSTRTCEVRTIQCAAARLCAWADDGGIRAPRHPSSERRCHGVCHAPDQPYVHHYYGDHHGRDGGGGEEVGKLWGGRVGWFELLRTGTRSRGEY